ncbi:hypothetical protein SLS62_006702 [Diatrype stigma]|uniref:Uncharacterized protein n=1 Tax=Diatrype stigma TaxID=117547 RepID=A0AAN9YNU8_9PEZI
MEREAPICRAIRDWRTYGLDSDGTHATPTRAPHLEPIYAYCHSTATTTTTVSATVEGEGDNSSSLRVRHRGHGNGGNNTLRGNETDGNGGDDADDEDENSGDDNHHYHHYHHHHHHHHHNNGGDDGSESDGNGGAPHGTQGGSGGSNRRGPSRANNGSVNSNFNANGPNGTNGTSSRGSGSGNGNPNSNSNSNSNSNGLNRLTRWDWDASQTPSRVPWDQNDNGGGVDGDSGGYRLRARHLAHQEYRNRIHGVYTPWDPALAWRGETSTPSSSAQQQQTAGPTNHTGSRPGPRPEAGPTLGAGLPTIAARIGGGGSGSGRGRGRGHHRGHGGRINAQQQTPNRPSQGRVHADAGMGTGMGTSAIDRTPPANAPLGPRDWLRRNYLITPPPSPPGHTPPGRGSADGGGKGKGSGSGSGSGNGDGNDVGRSNSNGNSIVDGSTTLNGGAAPFSPFWSADDNTPTTTTDTTPEQLYGGLTFRPISAPLFESWLHNNPMALCLLQEFGEDLEDLFPFPSPSPSPPTSREDPAGFSSPVAEAGPSSAMDATNHRPPSWWGDGLEKKQDDEEGGDKEEKEDEEEEDEEEEDEEGEDDDEEDDEDDDDDHNEDEGDEGGAAAATIATTTTAVENSGNETDTTWKSDDTLVDPGRGVVNSQAVYTEPPPRRLGPARSWRQERENLERAARDDGAAGAAPPAAGVAPIGTAHVSYGIPPSQGQEQGQLGDADADANAIRDARLSEMYPQYRRHDQSQEPPQYRLQHYYDHHQVQPPYEQNYYNQQLQQDRERYQNQQRRQQQRLRRRQWRQQQQMDQQLRDYPAPPLIPMLQPPFTSLQPLPTRLDHYPYIPHDLAPAAAAGTLPRHGMRGRPSTPYPRPLGGYDSDDDGDDYGLPEPFREPIRGPLSSRPRVTPRDNHNPYITSPPWHQPRPRDPTSLPPPPASSAPPLPPRPPHRHHPPSASIANPPNQPQNLEQAINLQYDQQLVRRYLGPLGVELGLQDMLTLVPSRDNDDEEEEEDGGGAGENGCSEEGDGEEEGRG